MKKVLNIFLTICCFMNIQSCFAAIEVLPTMQSRTNAQDKVWVGTFQLVWNDFVNKVVFNPVRFREGTPTMVYELNKQKFTTEDLSEKSYYKYLKCNILIEKCYDYLDVILKLQWRGKHNILGDGRIDFWLFKIISSWIRWI